MNLFIVESPTKARTIQKLLGKSFVVKATLGHIKDLPSKEIGVDEKTLKAKYVYIKGKKKIVYNLKKLAQKAENVYIGTDPDREGEAIAYFLSKELRTSNGKVKRVVFYEITSESLKRSIEKAGAVNMNMVYSQFARRILDRLVGYRVSPILWKYLKNNKLSAGRVQSPALRLVVEREKERENFKRKKYYYVKVTFEKEGISFTAVYQTRYEDPSEAKLVADKIRDGLYAVSDIKVEMESIPPPKPFITSSLQSEANAKLNFSSEKTQLLAQRLYEKGFITYPRTDSFRMEKRKAQEFMSYIVNKFGNEYVGKLRKFKEKPTSQGAHECIRPVSLKKEPAEEDERSLYRLILSRTLASLMANLIVKRQTVFIEVSSPFLKKPLLLIAKGVYKDFEGWTKVYPSDIKEEKLPLLKKGDLLKPLKVYVEEKKTEPPPRYTEGSLIKTLEKLGIGRPSTYTSVVKLLKERKYVNLYRKSLIPTETAFRVVEFLKENFPLLIDYGFTAYMEKQLDKVETGELDWKECVRFLFQRVFKEK